MKARVHTDENLESLAREANYSVAVLARKCGRSPRQLERDFRDRFGKTPKAWLDELWVADALEALRSEGSATGAALRMNYKHWHNFSRDFKRLFGVRPSHALKRHAEQAVFMGPAKLH